MGSNLTSRQSFSLMIISALCAISFLIMYIKDSNYKYNAPIYYMEASIEYISNENHRIKATLINRANSDIMIDDLIFVVRNNKFDKFETYNISDIYLNPNEIYHINNEVFIPDSSPSSIKYDSIKIKSASINGTMYEIKKSNNGIDFGKNDSAGSSAQIVLIVAFSIAAIVLLTIFISNAKDDGGIIKTLGLNRKHNKIVRQSKKEFQFRSYLEKNIIMNLVLSNKEFFDKEFNNKEKLTSYIVKLYNSTDDFSYPEEKFYIKEVKSNKFTIYTIKLPYSYTSVNIIGIISYEHHNEYYTSSNEMIVEHRYTLPLLTIYKLSQQNDQESMLDAVSRRLKEIAEESILKTQSVD